MSQFFITGIEFTQATQFRQAYDLAARLPIPDNSIPLIAGKNLVLRVYVSGATAGNWVGATAFPVGTVPGFPAMRVGQGFRMGTLLSMRSDLRTTVQISFTIPVAGTFDFDVYAMQYPPQSGTGGTLVSPPFRIRLVFEERRLIRIRLVRIRYSSASRNLMAAAPTVDDFWKSAAVARRMLPVPDPGFEIVRDSVELYDGEFLRIDPSAHDQSWSGNSANNGTTGNLLNIMDRLANSEGLPADVFYVGMYPDGVNQSSFVGWAVSRWLLTDKSGTTLAHETGHKLRLAHAPCGGPAAVDAAYPKYGGLPDGSIGQYGLDTVAMELKDPANTYDLMGYCSPRWISPYHYSKAFAALVPLRPVTNDSLFDPGKFFLPIDLYRIRNRWVKTDLEILPGNGSPFPPFPFPKTTQSGEMPVLRQFNRSGKQVAVTELETGKASSEAAEELDQRIFGDVEVSPSATRYEIIWKGKKIFESKMATQPLPFSVTWPSDGVSGAVSWKVTGVPDYLMLRIGTKGGRTPGYKTILLSPKESEFKLNPDWIPSQLTYHLELIAVRKGRIGIARSKEYPPFLQEAQVKVLLPLEGTTVKQGDYLSLDAISSNPQASIQWFSHIDGCISNAGTGLSNPLSPGTHILEARSDLPFERAGRVMVKVKG